MKRMGATVYVYISQAMVGDALRRLEHEADIFLLERQPDADRELWVLRSDLFPAFYEGREIVFFARPGKPGFDGFRAVIKKTGDGKRLQ